MSYRLNQVKRSPVASWILDDTAPFQEQTGSGFAGVIKSGSSAPSTSTPLVAGAGFSSVFSSGAQGQFTTPVFKPGHEKKSFALEAWVSVVSGSTSEQQILSNNGLYDGLTINGNIVKFSTQYATSGKAECQYDLGVARAAYVVGIHTRTHNQLWVDGVLVDSVELTDEQKNDTFAAAIDNNLYTGLTVGSQKIAVNGLAVYNVLTEDDMLRNLAAGRDVVPQASIPIQFNGVPLSLSADLGAVYFERTWAVRDDFSNGYGISVNIEDDQISPSLDTNELSIAGSWTTSILLDGGGITSAYGVFAEWSGANVIIEGSLNGTTWTALTSGRLVPMITNGYNTTGKMLHVRARFVSGLAEQTAYLESLTLIGFANNSITSTEARAITATYPAVPRGDFEPILYRDDNGVSLNGGSISIGPDTSTDQNVAKTLELWIKPISGTVTITGVSATKYRNGVVSSTLPLGEWSLIHYSQTTNITGTITVTGDAIVGQAALYPTQLTATEVAHIWKSYTGKPVLSFVDTGAITISETSTPANLYVRDWSIDGGGG